MMVDIALKRKTHERLTRELMALDVATGGIKHTYDDVINDLLDRKRK